MAILDLYEKSKTSANAVSDSTKNAAKYQDVISKEGSIILTQVTSPTNASNLEKTPGVPSYTEEVFNGNK
jgi:hypothetical protein